MQTVGISIQVKGMKKIQRDLKNFPIKANREYTRACVLGARSLAEGARGQSRTPVDTGRMKASISHRKLGRLAAATFVGARYGIYVHEGTSRMSARPFLQWALKGGIQRAIDQIFRRAMNRVP